MPTKRSVAADIFAEGSGISDHEIRKMMKIRISSSLPLELEEKVIAGNKVITKLRETLSEVTRGKNDFVRCAISSEKLARAGWIHALEHNQVLNEKLKQLEQDDIILKDKAKDTILELSLSQDRVENLRDEVKELKCKLREAEIAEKRATIKLEVEKALHQQNQQNNKG